jgi:CTP:molybdopterin cytidylyltransferase MocA
MYSGLHILILAAGSSKRLGQPKQLVRLGGQPALHRVVSNAVAVAGHAVTVVAGAHVRELTYLLNQTPASMVVNRHWEEGMGSSLRFGVTTLPPACEAVLVLLGDQVAVTKDDLRRLIGAWKGQEEVLAAAVYERHAGVPAIFPRICFPELAALRGDEGARSVSQRNQFRLVRVGMPNAAVDLDTPEDLAALSECFHSADPAAQPMRSAAGLRGAPDEDRTT